MHTKHNWLTTPITADLLRGALDLERTEHGAGLEQQPLGQWR